MASRWKPAWALSPRWVGENSDHSLLDLANNRIRLIMDNLHDLHAATSAIRVGAVAAIAVMGPLYIAAFSLGAERLKEAGASLPYIVVATLVGSTLWSVAMLLFWAPPHIQAHPDGARVGACIGLAIGLIALAASLLRSGREAN
jgi:hypothetical protein